jgi:uncharacterized membrane protein YphA (DoxX/SURF4 family)
MNSKKLTAYGPLPIRIVAGIAFMVYGLPKISSIAATQNLFSHMMGITNWIIGSNRWHYNTDWNSN